MRPSLVEIFEKAGSYADNSTAARFLQQNRTPALLAILQYAFHPKAKFNVQFPSQYKLSDVPDDLAHFNLYTESRRLYVFLDTCTLRASKKTEILLMLLENLPKTEAIFLTTLIKGEGNYALSPQAVDLAFPGLIMPPGEKISSDKEKKDIKVEIPVAVDKPKKKVYPKAKKSLIKRNKPVPKTDVVVEVTPEPVS